jgi:hypothetical protein
VDGPVLGAIITASVALVVAVGGAARSALQATLDRRYERRRMFLIQAQDAMLALREELAAYGVALHEQVSGDSPAVAGIGSLGIDGPDPAAITTTVTDQRAQPGPAPASASFVMAVPAAASLRVATARGRLTVARSRLEDATVAQAMARWEPLAQANRIDPHDTQTAAEEAAFAEVNELIRQALGSLRGTVPRGRRRAASR